VNLMFGLFRLSVSVPLAAFAIAASLLCSVARTALLEAQAVNEKARLQLGNEQLEGLAIRDPLIGIGNRRSLTGVYAQLQALTGSEGLSPVGRY
jgi:hypothetical protein